MFFPDDAQTFVLHVFVSLKERQGSHSVDLPALIGIKCSSDVKEQGCEQIQDKVNLIHRKRFALQVVH
jgi:hypothetical protein